jgi:hypothetical protein
MDVADARSRMKKRLDIADSITTFDDMIDEFVIDGVGRLAPTVYQQVASQTVPITVSDNGEASVDISGLTTPLDDVREVEAVVNGFAFPADMFNIHDTILRVRELPSDASSLQILGLKEYELATVPRYLHLAVFYFAQSEFYTFLMANKNKYNVYMQNGRSAVDSLQDLVDFWEQKGINYLEDKSQPYGR